MLMGGELRLGHLSSHQSRDQGWQRDNLRTGVALRQAEALGAPRPPARDRVRWPAGRSGSVILAVRRPVASYKEPGTCC